MSRDPESILAIRLGGIGEVLAVSPALRAIRARYGRARLALLAEHPASELAGDWVDEVIVADAPYRAAGARDLLDPRLYLDSLRLAGRVLRRRWDLFLDFHHRFAARHMVKPLLAALLSRAPRRIGFGPKFFLTDPVCDPDDRPLFERNRAFLSALGIGLPDARPTLTVAPADAEWIDALLDALRLGDRRLIALSPGSSRPFTRWGIEGFRVAAARLSHRGSLVVVGTAAERPLGEALGPGVVNLAGRTTVGRLAALLRRCALLVTNDSGPMHMAAALGTPVVGLFRPGELRRWGGYDPRRFRGLAREGPGADAGRTLPLIPVDDVVAASLELLDATPARP